MGLNLNYYQILGVSQDDDKAAISKAYARLMRNYHPDRIGDNGTAFSEALNEAKDTLMDDDKRKEYDEKLARGEEPDDDSEQADDKSSDEEYDFVETPGEHVPVNNDADSMTGDTVTVKPKVKTKSVPVRPMRFGRCFSWRLMIILPIVFLAPFLVLRPFAGLVSFKPAGLEPMIANIVLMVTVIGAMVALVMSMRSRGDQVVLAIASSVVLMLEVIGLPASAVLMRLGLVVLLVFNVLFELVRVLLAMSFDRFFIKHTGEPLFMVVAIVPMEGDDVYRLKNILDGSSRQTNLWDTANLGDIVRIDDSGDVNDRCQSIKFEDWIDVGNHGVLSKIIGSPRAIDRS